MMRIALTGNRLAGKDTVASAFSKAGVPVFNADPIIKFILNYRTDLEQFARKDKLLGDGIFYQGFIDPDKIRTSEQFEKLLEIIEFDLFSAYEKWAEKFEKTNAYTIFHSSIIFENGWDSHFDKIISVFTPRDDRKMRVRYETNLSISDIENLLDSEMDEYNKNGKSSYIIHSYAGRDVNRQVSDCNKMICDEIRAQELIERKSKIKSPQSKFNGFVM